MLETLLIAYFFHHVTLPTTHREPDVRYVQSVLRRGNLHITAESPSGVSIPPGSQRVEMLRLQLRAGCLNDVPLHSITVRRRGLGANSDIDSVYAVANGQRISSARPISRRDGLVDLNIRRYVIPACEKIDVSIMVDFSANAAIAGEHRFEVYPHDIDAGGVSVSLDNRVSRVSARRTSGRSIGQIAVTYLKLTRRVRFGNRQIVSRFRLTADRADDHVVHAITFTNNGSAANTDLQNLYIESGRNQRYTHIASSMIGDRVRLEFDPPLLIEKNKSRKLRLRADVRASSSRTIQFRIEEPGDIEASASRGR